MSRLLVVASACYNLSIGIFRNKTMKIKSLLTAVCSIACLSAGIAHAQRSDVSTGLPLHSQYWLSSQSGDGQSHNVILRSDGSDNTEVNAPSGKKINLSVAGTPVSNINSTGQAFIGTAQHSFPLPSVITPSTSYPTPNAGDTASGRFNLVASSAPTATYVELPRATPNAGKTFSVYNQAAANPVAIVPQSGDAVNAVAAGTPFSCAAGKWCECTAITASLYMCRAS